MPAFHEWLQTENVPVLFARQFEHMDTDPSKWKLISMSRFFTRSDKSWSSALIFGDSYVKKTLRGLPGFFIAVLFFQVDR